jgi:copper chaperone CopZ
MKRFFFIAAMLISFASMANFRSANLTASGLTCSMCSKAIFKALEKVSFVESVQADIKNSSYKIAFKKNTAVDPDVLSKAVKDAGFSVAKLQLNIDFTQDKVQNDAHIKVGGRTLHFVNVNAQTLNGEKSVTLIDKNFTTDKEHKRYKQFTSMKCYQTGKMESCCKDGKGAERVYHVTI